MLLQSFVIGHPNNNMCHFHPYNILYLDHNIGLNSHHIPDLHKDHRMYLQALFVMAALLVSAFLVGLSSSRFLLFRCILFFLCFFSTFFFWFKSSQFTFQLSNASNPKQDKQTDPLILLKHSDIWKAS
mgnify:CR=1 FL=1